MDGTGCIDPDDLRRAITASTILVSVMHANNEVGTIMPIEACTAIAREHGGPFHTDAAQSVGKVPTRVDDLGVDLLSITGHKVHAPKGIGALYIRAGTTLEPLVHGAGHEHGRRVPAPRARCSRPRWARRAGWPATGRRWRESRGCAIGSGRPSGNGSAIGSPSTANHARTVTAEHLEHAVAELRL